MPQPSINKKLICQSRNLSYFVTYLYFIMQCIKITYRIQNITISVIKTIAKVMLERNNMFKKKEKYLLEDKEWKEKNKLYLKEVQSFLDKVDNVSDESLRQKIVSQMLRCDKVLTEIAENRFREFYELGYKNAKKE